jgi:hypothetical protein
MKTCKDCIYYERCDTIFDGLLSNRDNKPCEQFDDNAYYVKLPAYIGMEVWIPDVWYSYNPESLQVKIIEGKVSMLQQKVDKSWKIRVSINHAVYDYTLDDFSTRVFLTHKAAEAKLEELIVKMKAKYNCEEVHRCEM